MTTTTTHQDFKRFGDGYLPGLVGVEIITVSKEFVESRLAVRREVMAPNGFLHAASVIALDSVSAASLARYSSTTSSPSPSSRSASGRPRSGAGPPDRRGTVSACRPSSGSRAASS